MRQPDQITIDRALLLYLLQLGDEHGMGSDVKLQQMAFLAELQMFGQDFKGFHFEFLYLYPHIRSSFDLIFLVVTY